MIAFAGESPVLCPPTVANMLTVHDNRRSRSKSPSGRDRSRSHSRDTRARSPPKEHKKKSIQISIGEQESDSEGSDRGDHRSRDKRSSKKYYESDSEEDRRRHKNHSKKHSDSESSDSDRHRKKSSSKKYYDSDSDDRRHAKSHRSSHKKGSDSDSDRHKKKHSSNKRYESESSSEEDSRHRRHSKERRRDDRDPRDPRYAGYAQPPPYTYAVPGQLVPVAVPDPRAPYRDIRHMSYDDGHHGHYDDRHHSISGPEGHRYADPTAYRYADPKDPRSKKEEAKTVYQTGKDGKEYVKTYDKAGNVKLVEVKPETKRDDRKRHDSEADRIGGRMSSLTVGGTLGAGLAVAAHNGHDGGRPPASPLLEAYRGTYQSISPMPFLPISNHEHDSDLSDLDLSGSDSESRRRKKVQYAREHRESEASITVLSKKRVSFYDPSEDAKKIEAALHGTHHPPNKKILIKILPGLSDDDIMALRTEYKKIAKLNGQGINIAKHIKTRLGPTHLGTAAYATALGRWESEAYWANSYYQSGSSRRELLIESLMGRSNSDIREIKNCFKDKKYNDDLEKSMKVELKADKFRMAILLALEEIRMPESQPLDRELIERDVVDLYKALTAPTGGETALIQIIVVRSDNHLREVMRVFEKVYRRNFAREMISKSRNLVVSTSLASFSLHY